MNSGGISLVELLSYWDGAWHLSIAVDGYTERSRAFLPLYAVTARLSALFSTETGVILISGSLLSTLLLFFFIFLSNRSSAELLKPLTGWGWAFFLITPASYVFHSFHTESLFLVLSLAAFMTASKGRYKEAAILAGLCALTRHQGVFVAAACAVWATEFSVKESRPKWLMFLESGLISGALWSIVPLYHFSQGAPLLAATDATVNYWSTVTSAKEYFQTFLFMNPNQNTSLGSFVHHGFYFFLLALVLYTWKNGPRPLFYYGLLSLLIMPMSGHLEVDFRFGAVLFPFLFLFGDNLAKAPNPVRFGVLGLCLVLNFYVTWQYGINKWAY